MMSSRSKYLARVLMDRARALAGSLADDEAKSARERMRDLVVKVLVVEEGITEESKVRLVLDALPSIGRGRSYSDRDLQELAELLETRLW